ncbi:hypothetical protein, partial [Ideonella sp.]|uniref:hypothetical protein n=1 Tax=Ideonella sp. TaxID=1929293 RepID=UPI003BB4FFF2
MLSLGTPAWAQVPAAPAPTIVLPAGQARALPAVKGKAIDTRTQQEADRPMKRILEAAALAAAAAAATPTAPPTVTAKATG